MVTLTPQNIAVTTRSLSAFDPSQPHQRDFGRLTFLGGLVLNSPSEHFGGYSAIAVDKEGERFLAVADTGTWLIGDINRTNGQLSGIAGTRIGPIPMGHRSAEEKRMRDVEGIVQLHHGALEGHYLFTFECEHRVCEYVLESGELKGPVGELPLPAVFDALSENEGLEAATLLRGGRFAGGIVLFAEEPLSGEPNITGAVMFNGTSETLTVKRHEKFAICDVQSLADGSLVFLERSYAAKQQGIRLRLVKAQDVRPDAVMDGEILLDAKRNMSSETGHEIDNFEGLAVHETEQGETILTLISDNNFSSSQRTLLVEFKLQQ